MTADRPDAESNRRIVERFFEEFVNRRDADAAAELLREGYVRHAPSPGGAVRGARPDNRVRRGTGAGVPRCERDRRRTVLGRRQGVVRATERGTHEGEFAGYEPAGNSFEVGGIAIHRVADGRIAETWAQWDYLGMLRRLGLVSGPSGRRSE